MRYSGKDPKKSVAEGYFTPKKRFFEYEMEKFSLRRKFPFLQVSVKRTACR
jgi:hypothetical protein